MTAVVFKAVVFPGRIDHELLIKPLTVLSDQPNPGDAVSPGGDPNAGLPGQLNSASSASGSGSGAVPVVNGASYPGAMALNAASSSEGNAAGSPKSRDRILSPQQARVMQIARSTPQGGKLASLSSVEL